MERERKRDENAYEYSLQLGFEVEKKETDMFLE